jgi:hypothetical protein
MRARLSRWIFRTPPHGREIDVLAPMREATADPDRVTRADPVGRVAELARDHHHHRQARWHAAIDLTVMHPDMFTTFDDIGGDRGPNSGTKAQTINRLDGGDAAAWGAFDPRTVMAKYGRYVGVAGYFDDSQESSGSTRTARCASGIRRSR